MMAKAATADGANTEKERENLMAEARNPIVPRTDLHHQHIVEEAEAAAEAGVHALYQTPRTQAELTRREGTSQRIQD
jgi:hypothetical protein